MSIFEKYADYYDLFYQDKDTGDECAFVLDAVRRFGQSKCERILDIGCGTGRHAVPLALHGFSMTGIDASERMLAHARENAERNKVEIALHQGDLRTGTVDGQFDCALALFGVMSYMTTNDDVAAALQNIHRHIRPEGLFVFDVWNGLAVLREGPQTRVTRFNHRGATILRTVRPEIDAVHHLCRNHYLILDADSNRPASMVEETHVMRFFFPQELAYFLSCAGFVPEQLCAYPRLDAPVDETVWNMAVIARKTRMGA